ncbi:2-C-methyl-D-erythritol 4-phosphate cytidylyltransferase [Candidatus Ruthia magnifica str. Cm (Calyptogena magnifica)]|uniref:2-C-methyl-D-erythritol 4-phosphate cytidylyltransferase n=1 Tax=Ruthia magnifica subsp. Calyptogena magnifica TaxID=413404 RepID=ISPD_RUTMC|nr:2-C-methyl-D-erythritol 4-phosphate cytidylyltransferase [Candidatus Ruthturnera calyptogenae]A1AX25.1 RecName: Full=2-C-methyl-D-erythritol 4-phosphate cytidylyltransferase; AltName: Full=4-diphosphocytidyl-2C-methyl-D-erythritol synthase; AltName: Full=MEP cytidylyltransferase; Short=MCT [Candidatus Ruthia magnifica str. Cm (Calyptogena magnifica)]ABL02482.1 2-C-methyl-D-erythritol 4-phosphate cytidylyltransferase [Candidatus Ruthia magnifica str. Cm (Calyptogena magnifica)]
MPSHYYLIIPASGVGVRMHPEKDGLNEQPKQYLKLDNGLTILDQTLKTLLSINQIKSCVIAIKNKDHLFAKSAFNNHPKLLTIVTGGKERMYSVLNALKALIDFAKDDDWVLVHDSVRPCVKASEIINLMKQLKHHATGGLLATKVVDTIKQADNNIINTTIDRSNLWQAQTPQMYRFSVLLKALNTAIKDGINITDETSAIEHLGLESILVKSSKSNIKVTNPEDLILANFYLNQHQK